MKLSRLLFPQRCVLCGARLGPGSAAMLCPACAVTVRTRYRVTEQVRVEGTDGALAPLLYQGLVRDALRRYKFHGAKACARWFAAQLAPPVVEWLDSWRPDLVTYVPVGLWRARERGYNQSALVARMLAKQLGLPCVPLLRKRLFVARQSALSAQARARNAENAFRLRRGARAAGKRVLLVDDVVTTGATAAACARVLRQGGAERVFLVAMTKSPRRSLQIRCKTGNS